MPPKRRIAFVCHPYHRGGVTRWMADAAIAASADSEVYFVTVKPKKEFLNAGGREQITAILQPHAHRLKLIAAPVDLFFEFGTGAYRSAVYADIVVKNVPAGTTIIVSDDIDVWNGVGLIAGSYPMVGVLHGDQDVYYNMAIAHKAHLSAAVCVSGRIGRKLAEKCPYIDRANIHVIPCGIEMPPMPAPVTAHTEIRLAFVGRLTDYEKRAYDLVGICAELHRQNVQFRLHIAGDSEASRAECLEMLRKEGVEGFVSFHGWLGAHAVQELLRQTDILLLTSNSEGMPVSMMEGLAMGCGFVGTRVSGVEDVEQHTLAPDCVGIYAIGNIREAVERISAVASVPVERRRAAARAIAEQEFSMEHCLERYFEVIERLPATTKKLEAPVLPADNIRSKLLAFARYLKVRWTK